MGNVEWTLSENLIITTYLKEFRLKVLLGTSKTLAQEQIATELLELYPEVFENRDVNTLGDHISYWDRLTNGEITNVPEKDKAYIGTIPNLMWERSRS